MELYQPFYDPNITPKHKKYSVYVLSNTGKPKLISFGDNRYQQFFDKLGLYSHLNHEDPKRRNNYRRRHANDHINDPNYPGFWSYNYLW